MQRCGGTGVGLHVVRLQVLLLRQQFLEFERLLIKIPAAVARDLVDRLQRLRAGPQRILIGVDPDRTVRYGAADRRTLRQRGFVIERQGGALPS